MNIKCRGDFVLYDHKDFRTQNMPKFLYHIAIYSHSNIRIHTRSLSHTFTNIY